MRIALVIIIGSWLLFVVSFFLPATNLQQTPGTTPGKPLTGWQALTTPIFVGLVYPWLWFAEPDAYFFLIFPIANGVMLFAPLLSCLIREVVIALALFFLACAFLPWIMPNPLFGDLFVGFYCWNGSFFIMSLGCLLASDSYPIVNSHW